MPDEAWELVRASLRAHRNRLHDHVGVHVPASGRAAHDHWEKGHFFGVPKKPARAARGARSAPEGRREAPRSGAGCRAAAQSAAAGG